MCHSSWVKVKSYRVSSFLSLISLLISVAFFTLIERKVLSYIILRKGPNKPSVCGLVTPFADALKLLSKCFIFPSGSVSTLMQLSCVFAFLIPSVLWCFIFIPSFSFDWSFPLISVLIWMSLSVYCLLAAGWGSNSKYSVLGSTRCIAQVISYEVVFTILMLCFSLFLGLKFFAPSVFWFIALLPHLSLTLYVICLAETNRSPFDFAEGESELVSGYNVEFSGSGFVVLFLAEYLSILFISTLVATSSLGNNYSLFLIFSIFLAFSFIWARGTLPRFRYDQLMGLC